MRRAMFHIAGALAGLERKIKRERRVKRSRAPSMYTPPKGPDGSALREPIEMVATNSCITGSRLSNTPLA